MLLSSNLQSTVNKIFKAEKEHEQQLINEIVQEFNLNDDQEQAFHIVENHTTMRKCEQLKMYLGGMGGTGKS